MKFKNSSGNSSRLSDEEDQSLSGSGRPMPSKNSHTFTGTDDDQDNSPCSSTSKLMSNLNLIPNISSNSTATDDLNEEDKEVFRYDELALEGYPTMAAIRSQGGLCDIKIKIEDRVIQAHRIVLAATIPYFHAMLLTDMKESKQEEIELYSMDFEALEALVNFAYTGEIQITIHNVQRVMMVAAFLQVNKVKEACARFLIQRLALENVIGARTFAESLNCKNVVIEADRYIQKNFVSVCKNEEFLQLGISEVLEILGRNELHVESEEQVFQVMMDWVNKDEELRSMYLPDLLKCVRLPLLTPQFISDHVAGQPLIRASLHCRDLLDEVRDYYLMPERRSSLQTFKTQPRCCDDVVGYIYVVGGLTKSGISCNIHSGSSCTLCDSVSTIEVYDPILERWQIVDAMKMLRSRVGVAVMQNRLYAVGGYNGLDRLNDAEVYDTRTNTWSKIPSMHYKRSAVGCCSFNGLRLYVCGGYDGTTSLRTVECYFPESNRWAMMSPMIKHRSAAGVVALQNFVYAIGGHDGMSIFDSVERFDTRIGVWSMVAPMKTKRCRLGAAVLQNKIYCCGGYDGSTFLKSVEMYDPLADVWTEVAPMSLMRSRVALVNNAGKLYAIGGYDGTSNLSTVEVYDPNKDCWKLISSMCAHEGGVGAATVPIDAV